MSEPRDWPNLVGGVASLAGLLGLRRLLRRTPPTSDTNDPFTRTEPVRALITAADAAFLDQALLMAHEVHKEEVASGNAVETKAGTLMSALGVMASLLVAAGALLFADDEPLGGAKVLPEAVIVCFLVAAVLLFRAFYHGFRALNIGVIARPDPRTFLELQADLTDQVAELKRRQLADLLVSHRRNRTANNEKAAHLNEGYRCARWAVAFLLLAAVLIAGHALWSEVDGWPE